MAVSLRAVEKIGQTIDCLLTEHRDEQAAKRFLTKAIRRHGVREKITIDGSAANEAAIKSYNAEHGTAIELRTITYLHNIVEQDHRAVKRVTRPMLGCKSFDAAQGTLTGIELMHMIRKRQMVVGRSRGPHCGRTVLRPGCLSPTQTRATCPLCLLGHNLRQNHTTRTHMRFLSIFQQVRAIANPRNQFSTSAAIMRQSTVRHRALDTPEPPVTMPHMTETAHRRHYVRIRLGEFTIWRLQCTTVRWARDCATLWTTSPPR